jgi:hypothetical protein
MGWDNNVDAWQLCGCSSEEEYNQQANNDSSFYDMMRQVVESKNPEKLDIVEMTKESVKIDFAKKVN